MIFNIYKQRGETPLECMERFRNSHPEYSNKPFDSTQGKPLDKTRGKQAWTYMGRLDPMAEGLLLGASGDDVLRKEEFTNLDKEYEFSILFGISTDTYDALGKIVSTNFPNCLENVNENRIIKMLDAYKGEREQKYPPYSSKTINGVAMHELARSGELETLEISNNIPTKKINIYELNLLSLDNISPKQLLSKIILDISKVKGDFRQEEILNLWQENLKDCRENFAVAHCKAFVSSGTYIRSIVSDLGKSLGCGALALFIKRTKVGDYRAEDSVM